MKRILSVMALSAACGLAACNSDGSFRTASNDDHNMTPANNYNASQTYTRDSVSQNGSVQYDANHMASAPAQPGNSIVPAQGPNVQLNHGNDKTTAAVALTNEDRQFVKDAATSGMYEVQASQKALTKSNDAHIKTFAQQMVDDHTKANDQLKALAVRKGVDLPMITPEQTKQLATLDGLNGSDFDREYISQQKAAHTDAISKFQWAASNSTDRDIRDWAAMTLPTLRSHLDMLNNNINSNTKVGSEK